MCKQQASSIWVQQKTQILLPIQYYTCTNQWKWRRVTSRQSSYMIFCLKTLCVAFSQTNNYFYIKKIPSVILFRAKPKNLYAIKIKSHFVTNEFWEMVSCECPNVSAHEKMFNHGMWHGTIWHCFLNKLSIFFISERKWFNA